jgi:hypothetical protein
MVSVLQPGLGCTVPAYRYHLPPDLSSCLLQGSFFRLQAQLVASKMELRRALKVADELRCRLEPAELALAALQQPKPQLRPVLGQ